MHKKIIYYALLVLPVLILGLSFVSNAREVTAQSTPTRIPLILKKEVKCVNSTPQVILSWNNPNEATKFNLFRNPNVNGVKIWAPIGSGTGSFLSYTDLKANKAGTYQYQIQALNGHQPVRHSDIMTVVVSPCPAPAVSQPVASAPVAQAPAPTTNTAPAPVPQTTTTVKKDLKWGAYPGWDIPVIKEFETKVGSNPDHIAAFVHWGYGNAFPTYLNAYAKDKGRTMIIFWEATNHQVGGSNQPAFSYDAIIRGDWDWYIRSFASQTKSYGGPVILIPFSEMNGNWFPWGAGINGNTPEKAITAYRHVHDVFSEVPNSNVKFGWAPNSNSVPDTTANKMENYYPGNAYVDIVGVDGFNFDTPWLTFDQIFGSPLKRLAVYNKPIYIFSFASAQGPNKAAWMRDAFFTQMPKYPLLEGWVWFHQNKEKDWRIWSDQASLDVFKEAIK